MNSSRTAPRPPPSRVPHAVMFHHFHNGDGAGGQGAITPAQLDGVIDAYGPDRLLSADAWLTRARAGALREGDACLSFDDGLRCQVELAAPVLRRRGLNALFFVPTSILDESAPLDRLEAYRAFRTTAFDHVDDFYEAFDQAVDASAYATDVGVALGRYDHADYAHFPFYSPGDSRFRFLRDEALGPPRYHELMTDLIARHGRSIAELSDGLFMSAEDLRSLRAEGHEIGLHSHSHPTVLAGLDIEEQRREYQRNQDELARITGARATTCAHPCNSYSQDTLVILRDLGVDVAFCSNLSVCGATLLELPREDHSNIVRAFGIAST